ncbi:MAG: hypothetical protein HN793_07170 [Rhodospirillaceae bacterium]|nr:hypothetical protein [Rhodospirillaceae bacterium]MBT5241486.1 hypothetical protein [Rhodospirillaceae bacterium]MBT5566244.1 hypothetical protein [Rhodospirillaceae bacterium]MBT6088962.1 hypothetical protein [Rhodospirillaceae bacterium]MBT6961876.1 hypothetical protein [Rhodospirillaceae bacterium]
MTDIDPASSPDRPLANGEDTEALRQMQRDIQQEIYRRHIIRQIDDTVLGPPPEQDGETEDLNDDDKKADRENGALAAWLGLTKEGDAVEAMIAAQLVATHELAMAVMGRAITRTSQPGHFGAYVTDACRAANATLRQIETLARYRTWRAQDSRVPNGLSAPR